MDGMPISLQRTRPDADPRLARVPLAMLFAWLADGAAQPAPVAVFEAADVADDIAPQRAKPLPLRPLAEMVPPDAVPEPSAPAVPVALAPSPPVAQTIVEPSVQAAPSPVEPEGVSAPLFLPPPLIAPVLRPRRKPSRADDFLPGRPTE